MPGDAAVSPGFERRQNRRRKGNRANDRLEHLLGYGTRAQNGWRTHKGKHRGFHAKAARPAIDDKVNLALHVCAHMLRRSWAGFPRKVCARRRDGHARSADERERRFYYPACAQQPFRALP